MRPPFASPEEAYLAAERLAPTKSDYLAGELLPLAPASSAHLQLSANVCALLQSQTRGQDCLVLASATRLYIPEGPLYTYPDAALVCGPAQWQPDGHHDNLLNPTLLVKVLPHAMPAHFPQVFELYFSLPTVQHVVLVTEYAVRVSLGSRHANGLQVYGFTALTDVLLLPDLGLELPLAELYHKVPLSA